jgi:hypothetical protein
MLSWVLLHLVSKPEQNAQAGNDEATSSTVRSFFGCCRALSPLYHTSSSSQYMSLKSIEYSAPVLKFIVMISRIVSPQTQEGFGDKGLPPSPMFHLFLLFCTGRPGISADLWVLAASINNLYVCSILIFQRRSTIISNHVLVLCYETMSWLDWFWRPGISARIGIFVYVEHQPIMPI